MAGLFVFEGPDGVGKSTVLARVADQLGSVGLRFESLSFPGREPGTLGERVYDLHHDLLRASPSLRPSSVSLQLLHVAAHIDAIERRILPALAKGTSVLLDRYWWSTWAYGVASGVPRSQLDAMLTLERHAWRGVLPTAVFLLRRANTRAPAGLVATYRKLAQAESHFHRVVELPNDGALHVTSERATSIVVAATAPTAIDSAIPLAVGAQPPPRPSTVVPRRRAPERRQAPLVFSRLAPAEPTYVYDTYWRFATERQAIFFRRLRGAQPPLTTDPILLDYKFTNAYRASDRVSQFLIRHVIFGGPQTPDDLFFRTILFKLFNRIDTWRLLEGSLGEIRFSSYDFDHVDRLLSNALTSGERIYSAAYIMPTAKAFGADDRKHRTHLRLLERMMADGLPKRIAESRSMRAAFELLRSYPMLGDFLAYQFVTDLNYSPLTNFTEMEFVMPGPGARDGIRKCFSSPGGLNDSDIIRLVADRQEVEFHRLGLPFESLWGRRLQLIDCQNLFCEVDKYARLAHPEAVGVSGRTRIKQNYHSHDERIAYWYPPKWGINEALETYLARAAR